MEHLTSTTRSVHLKTAGPLTRFLYLLILILFFILAIVVAIPLIILAALIGLVAALYFKIKHTLTRAKSPNGPLDGRQNVKVINRDE